MTTLAFDTHKAVKALREAGADELLAEAVVATVGDAVRENMATKADIAEMRTELAEAKTELKADISEVRAELKADISEVRAELKADISEVRVELKADISEVRAELKADLAEVKADLAGLEARLYRHLWVMAAGIVGLTVTLVKLLA